MSWTEIDNAGMGSRLTMTGWMVRGFLKPADRFAEQFGPVAQLELHLDAGAVGAAQ